MFLFSLEPTALHLILKITDSPDPRDSLQNAAYVYNAGMDASTKWKIAGIVFAIVPILFLLVFAVGEGASGIGHYGQLVPIALLTIFGWYTPRPVGFVMIFAGIALMILYAISAHGSVTLAAIALVEVIVFIPMILSGFSFLRSQNR